ncbi:MAG: hypothetical protein ACYC9Y_14650 [Candidatus Methylomirabilia bacterium]
MVSRPTPAEQSWIDAAAVPAKAVLCVPLAAAFNRLEVGIFEPHLAEDCSYESQSVLEGLRGKRDVLSYLGEKFAALRAAGDAHLATAELAADPGGKPSVLLRQRSSLYGRPGLGAIAGFFRVFPAADGERLGRLVLVTSVPPPELCRGAGLFPGLSADELRRAREFEGERIPLSEEVVFTLFAMQRVLACDEMVRDLRDLVAGYAPAKLRLVTPKNREACIRHGVTGFPTLLVTWRGTTVRTLDGYHSNAKVREALADLFQP